MADLTTKLANLIDPEVMAPMISAQLPKAIKFGGIAPIDNSLEGQPGSEITVPKYKYIGDAQDVAEGAAIDYSALETETVKHGIKKAGKGVTLTDESVLSGYGKPVEEAQKQVRMAIASKVDNDILEEALTTTLEVKGAIGIGLIDKIENAFTDAPDAIEDESITSTGVLFLNYKDAAKLREEAAGSWTKASQLGDALLVKGTFGELLGWEIVRTKKLADGNALAVKAGALKTFLKRNILAEVGRDMDHKLTKFNADQHYAVALVDETKAVKVVPVAGN
ncbi:N4-gp56 family major capsid protein [Listeria innocua]|uniref:N4-gp56 family major capsid protein n=1 Tax=Listeria innocua TaxID=1642 RepID=UPI0019452FA5|nr:N4-gp56 family major capsid protein [Listeria innocua]EJE2882839.1 N4-gp56 family major capsid protein [Listeria monocytogenes]EEP3927544.1 N4-gp56 family major capsid protein [Listeria innocua]EJE2922212.1 N4-gp56 family major capsid protein [Listeria monocytogenes]EKZ0914426.1 N4-gp56 family major capsid protein [Listeria monocytogenes]EMA2095396.1 N4-gp56 family major capsid protein [Listeria monocytogenes]